MGQTESEDEKQADSVDVGQDIWARMAERINTSQIDDVGKVKMKGRPV